jgi:putative transposase
VNAPKLRECRGCAAAAGREHTPMCSVSQVFAGQNVGVTQVGETIWLVTFMQYDLGYFDDETCRLEPIENPFGPKLLPIRPE